MQDVLISSWRFDKLSVYTVSIFTISEKQDPTERHPTVLPLLFQSQLRQERGAGFHCCPSLDFVPRPSFLFSVCVLALDVRMTKQESSRNPETTPPLYTFLGPKPAHVARELALWGSVGKNQERNKPKC